MNKKTYYEYMNQFINCKTFDEVHTKWNACFHYILRSFNVHFDKRAIDSLFYDFDMSNWKALHKENTEYAGKSKRELINCFAGECSYICDRASYDRLFRTHWLFKQAFEDELNWVCFPNMYSENAHLIHAEIVS